MAGKLVGSFESGCKATFLMPTVLPHIRLITSSSIGKLSNANILNKYYITNNKLTIFRKNTIFY